MHEAVRTASSETDTNLNKLWLNLNQLPDSRHPKYASAVLTASSASKALSIAEAETQVAREAKEKWVEVARRMKEAREDLEQVRAEKVKEVESCKRAAEKALIRVLETRSKNYR